jgi:predicted  nucleic acid-binding Zn-ribbon protein
VSTTSFESALKSLDASLGQLEAAAQRKLDLERRRGDLETELAIMQDDRSRLATDLDGTLSRLRRVEGAADDAVKRLDRAMLAINAVLGDEIGQENEQENEQENAGSPEETPGGLEDSQGSDEHERGPAHLVDSPASRNGER